MTEISHIADDTGTRHWPQRDRTVLDWLVGESGETQGCRYFLKKDNVCGKVVSMRIGMGYDVHRLVEGRDLIIGGVKIPYEKGLLGHSDADVLIHAICDALLGAANMRDIGFHFPDTAGEFKDVDSKILLKRTVGLIATKGYRVGNIDATICAERPKLKAHIPAIQEKLAEVMETDTDDVSIKATTTEKLGFTGREEGISAYATVLIEKV